MVAARGVAVRRQQRVALGVVVGAAARRSASPSVVMRRRRRARASARSRSACSRATTEGSLVIAQRMVRVARRRAARRPGRGPAGSSAGRAACATTPASGRSPPATSTPYGRRAGIGRSGCQIRYDTASRAWSVTRSSGRNRASAASSSASVVGGSTAPSWRATNAVWATYSSRSAWSSGRAPYRWWDSRKLWISAMCTHSSRCGSVAVYGVPSGMVPTTRSWMARTTSTACWASSAVPKVVTARKRLVRARRPQMSPR